MVYGEAMKWLLLVAVVTLAGVGAFFGLRLRAERKAELAVVQSACAREITEEITVRLEVLKDAAHDGDRAVAAVNGLAVKDLYGKSSLGPHLAALSRLARDPDGVPRIKRLASLAAEQCPDVFPTAVKAERPVGYLILMAPEAD